MENVYEIIETSSDETDNSSEEELEENKDLRELNSEFLNYTNVNEYVKNRNALFTRDIQTIGIVVTKNDSHENSSDKYYFSQGPENNSNNTNHSVGGTVYKNIIGIELIKGYIRHNSSFHGYTSIIVDNIPYAACLKNKNEKKIVDNVSVSGGIS